MKNKRISFGVRLKKELADKLDKVVKDNSELNSTRSELIEAIIDAFFSTNDYIERGKRFILVKRKRNNDNN